MTEMNRTTMQFSAKPFDYPFAKLKEMQADTRANAFAAHLILPNRTTPPTKFCQTDHFLPYI
jgi:Zn-dependent peptidase ImmA (M78 family)